MTALPAVPAPGRPPRDCMTAESPARAPVRLAAEIRRIRQQLTSRDMLNNPRVTTELNELYKQVSAELDQHRGRHRLPATATPAHLAVTSAATTPTPAYLTVTSATTPTPAYLAVTSAATTPTPAPPAATKHGPGPRQAIGEPVPDASGLDLKPDPLTTSTSADFVGVLRRYRQWAGDPSLRDMAAQSGQQVAHSTMYVALKRTSLPKLKVVLAIVAGCGGSQDDQRAFASAWRQIKSGTSGTLSGGAAPASAALASAPPTSTPPPDGAPVPEHRQSPPDG